jgi:predicted amidohydrolase
MKVGYYQFDPAFGRTAENLARVLTALDKVEADLVVLPELPFTGYNFRDRDELASMAEDPDDSPTVSALTALCRDRDMHLVTGFAEKAADGLFNSALLIGPHGLVHVYRKLHLFDREKEYFDPGETPFAVHRIPGARIGMMICFDWVIPEAARKLALLGADVICHPSNLVLAHCQDAMVTRCIENGVFSVTTNRFGTDERPHGSVTFTGKSQITAPRGKVLHRGEPDREELFVAEIDISLAADKRVTPRNDVLRDRRPDFY